MSSIIGGYAPTRVNGDRLFNAGKQVWIKVETVSTNSATGAIVTSDITEDILSLGVTEEIPRVHNSTSPANYVGTHSNNGTATAPSANLTATAAQLASTFPDSRSIIKLQTFTIPRLFRRQQLPHFLRSGANAMECTVQRFKSATGASCRGRLRCRLHRRRCVSASGKLGNLRAS